MRRLLPIIRAKVSLVSKGRHFDCLLSERKNQPLESIWGVASLALRRE